MRALRQWLQAERAVVATVLATSFGYFLLWGGTTRPMGDSPAYRLAAEVVTGGWTQLTDRSPGFPLVLWATGAVHGESPLLFVVQLVMHAVAILLVVDLGRRVEVPRALRWALVVLLLAPPVVMKAAYSGSEATTELLVVAVVWCLYRWFEAPSTRLLVTLGAVLAGVALVRPTFQLLVVPIGALVWWRARGERPARAVAALGLPVVALLGVVVLYNGARFGSPALTPLLPWHLSAKTALFVEELPDRYEPARSHLVEVRDRLLVEDPEHVAATYAFASRAELVELTGRSGRDLDRWVLGMDLELIAHNPFGYLESVTQASARYVQLDAQPAGFGGSSLAGWLLSLVHAVVALAVVGVAVLVPGVALARGIDRRRAFLLAAVVAIVLYTAGVSVLLETGSARLRAPTDPLIVLGAVVGLTQLRNRMRPVGSRP